MMKLTSSSVAWGDMVSFDAESVVPTRVAPSHGKKNNTLKRIDDDMTARANETAWKGYLWKKKKRGCHLYTRWWVFSKSPPPFMDLLAYVPEASRGITVSTSWQ